MFSLLRSCNGRFFYLASIVLILLNFGLVNAQSTEKNTISREIKSDVEVKKGNLLNVTSAKLEKVTQQENTVQTEILQLSFFVPFEFGSFIPKSKATLTAYKENGSVSGMKIWKAFGANYKSENTTKPIPYNLELSSEFLKASSFILDFSFDVSGDSSNYNIASACRECADLAISVCGAGKVAGVKCPKDGSCEFTCK